MEREWGGEREGGREIGREKEGEREGRERERGEDEGRATQKSVGTGSTATDSQTDSDRGRQEGRSGLYRDRKLGRVTGRGHSSEVGVRRNVAAINCNGTNN